MVRSIATYVGQVSEFVIEVERRRQLLAGLQKELEPLARNGLIKVEGYVDQLNNLQLLLNTAMAQIDALRQVKTRDATNSHIQQLEEALGDVQWDLVDDFKANLAKRAEQQNEIIQKFQARFSEWPILVPRLRLALDEALGVRAPVQRKKKEIEWLEAKMLQIQRAFTDGEFEKLLATLTELDASPAKDPMYLKQMQEETMTASGFVRQADLLLLQAPLDSRNLYRYTVLLRTPSEPGTHGINIQEKCTLVSNDRKEMADAIVKITQAVNRGVTRAFNTRLRQNKPPAVEPPAGVQPAAAGGNGNSVPPAATPPEQRANSVGTAAVVASEQASAAEPGAAVDDATRKAEVIPPTGASPNPLNDPLMNTSLNDLVKDVGDFMYRIFMSHQLQNYLNESPCSLTITTNDLMLPWELMSYRAKDSPDDDKFLCLERPVARMPMGRYFPRHHRSIPRGRQLRFLLVYADPNDNLPFAKGEVDEIQDRLKEDWKESVDVVKMAGPDVTGRAMNEVLRKGSFDVIHFAGHAFFDDDDSELSGLLLHEGEHFLAQKVHRLLEGRPLVFLNACQSGFTANDDKPQQIEEYMQEKAEGLASAFIYGGATGCVGSLWPIYDKPARDLAVNFYNNVLEGFMIGDALRLARRKIKLDYDNQITWAAYVLYGDPTFRL